MIRLVPKEVCYLARYLPKANDELRNTQIRMNPEDLLIEASA